MSLHNTTITTKNMNADIDELSNVAQNASNPIPNTLAPSVSITGKRKASIEISDSATKKPTIESANMEKNLDFQGKKRKRKEEILNSISTTTRPSTHLNSLWVHLNQPNTARKSFGVTKEEPRFRNGSMYGINAFYLTPSGTQNTTGGKDHYRIDGLVPGGETSSSFYITELNEYNASAHILLLTRGNGIDVVLLKPVEEVFDGYTSKQIQAIWPKKKEKHKLASPEIRAIADRISRNNKSGGVGMTKAMHLNVFEEIVQLLRAKTPMVGAVKISFNLAKIKNLVNTFKELFETWIKQDGDHTHMYKKQRAAVVSEMADYLRASDIARFNAALALVTCDKQNIENESFTLASAKGTTTSITPSTVTTTSNTQLVYELKLDRLMVGVTAVANAMANVEVNSPQKTVIKQMLKSSALMHWIGPESVPTLDDMLEACGSDTGGSNSNMRKILARATEGTWYGILCLVVMCHQSNIDCSKIQGEGNETGQGNQKSCYDREKHLGKVKRHTGIPAKHSVPRTISVQFVSVLREKKHIFKAWKRILQEMQDFSDKPYWTDSNITETFTTLQIKIEESNSLKNEKNKWTKRESRNLVLSKLKWVFILYMESLPNGSEPTLNNFLTTMMSPVGSCFANAYIAW